MRFGLVTFQWGRDWDLPTLLANLERAGVFGVELRVEHEHRVDPTLTPAERAEVRRRFAQSPVELVGFGTNWEFHSPDPAEVRRQMEGAKAHIRLSHDVGGSGVKVKPNALPEGVPVDRTIDQIGRSLNQLGTYGADHGQEIRLEVHGRGTNQLPIVKRILDVADHPNVGACWNCNPADLEWPGLRANFGLVKNRLADVLHVHQFDAEDNQYPYQQLFDMLVEIDYDGWVLLEAQPIPGDRVEALREQHEIFQRMVRRARERS